MQPCSAIAGILRKEEWRNWNLAVLNVLSNNETLTPFQISKKIGTEIMKDSTQSYIYEIMSSICDKEKKVNGLYYLKMHEYIYWHGSSDPWDDPEISITLKGLYAYVLNKELINKMINLNILDEKERRHMNLDEVSFNFDIDVYKLVPPKITFYVVDNPKVLNDVTKYIFQIVPINTIFDNWIRNTLKKYSKINLDRISLNKINTGFKKSFRLVSSYFYIMLHAIGVIPSFFYYQSLDEFKHSLIKRVNKFEKKEISLEDLENRLSTACDTNLEQSLFNILENPDVINSIITFPDELKTRISKTRKGSPNYKILILKYLAENGPMRNYELSALLVSYPSVKPKKRSRISTRKDGPMRYLHESGYVVWPAYEEKYSRQPIYITEKGVFALLYLNKAYLSELLSKIQFEYNIPTLLEPTTRIPLGNEEWTDYLNLHLTCLIPLKPALLIWLYQVHTHSLERDLDDLDQVSIHAHFLSSIKLTLDLIINLIVNESVLHPYFHAEYNMVIHQVDDWIKNMLPDLSVDNLRKNRLQNKKELTKYEKKIINKFMSIADTDALERVFSSNR